MVASLFGLRSGVPSVHRSRLLQASSYRAAGKPERLLRAAVTAFCSITRPTRREIAQLDDLALPLLGAASDDCLRFIAAALSDLPSAPPNLVRRLADQPADISAPLLMRSPVLSPIDLVALIGRHGVPHARAIAARKDLDERIARLIRSILSLDSSAPDRAEETRTRLRAMMRPADAGSVAPRLEGGPDTWRRLRSTVLAGIPALFHTALADALDIPLQRARAIAGDDDVSGLATAFRALSLPEEQAFLLAKSLRPDRFAQRAAIAAFLDAYARIADETVAAALEEWREQPVHDQPANTASKPAIVRAS